MINRLLICLFSLISMAESAAQLCIAPDFTLTDINGQEFNLYETLDSDKVVILSIGATWSQASLDFHNQSYLEELYAEYGPLGTDQIRVLFVEVDDNTTLADMTGLGGNTLGDFISDISYPIANPNNALFPVAVFAAQGLPAVKIINPDGYEIVQDVKNAENKEEIEDALNEIITLILPMSLEQSFSGVSCFGGEDGTISLSIFGGLAPYEVLWEDGNSGVERMNLTAGIYTASITDANDNEISSTITVPEPEILELNSQMFPEINGQENGSIALTLIGGTEPYDFLWSTGETASEILNLPSGDYSVTAVDNNGCEISTEVFVDFYSSIYDVNDRELIVYPNPVKDKIFIKDINLLNVIALKMTSTLGHELILNSYQTSNGIGIDKFDASQGIYFLQILFDDLSFQSVKVVVQ